MKRYLKINGDFLWCQDAITREDLVQVANRTYDTIVDTVNGTMFNAKENSWDDIPTEGAKEK